MSTVDYMGIVALKLTGKVTNGPKLISTRIGIKLSN